MQAFRMRRSYQNTKHHAGRATLITQKPAALTHAAHASHTSYAQACPPYLAGLYLLDIQGQQKLGDSLKADALLSDTEVAHAVL